MVLKISILARCQMQQNSISIGYIVFQLHFQHIMKLSRLLVVINVKLLPFDPDKNLFYTFVPKESVRNLHLSITHLEYY